jgi:hypothetical protein
VPHMNASDHISAWLAQVYADAELPASVFKFAFDLTQRADASGMIKPRVADNAPMLAQLTARGHLFEVMKRSGKLAGHQIVCGPVKPPSPEPTAKKIMFPIEAQRGFVRSLARRMIAVPFEEAEVMLRNELRTREASLAQRGVDQNSILRQRHEFEAAMRSELWRLIFALRSNGDDVA